MNNSKKSTYIVATISLLVIIVAIYFLFIFQKSPNKIESDNSSSFVEDIQSIDIDKRPFVTLTPTADGAEIIISIEKMGEFDSMEYELTYQADNPQISGEKIERGSVESDIDTSQDKYKKSLLLGTASRGVRSPDTGIIDGRLKLHMYKGDTEFVSQSNWDRFQIGTTGGEIPDYAGVFLLDVPRLNKNHWVIIADTVGVPPNASFDPNKVLLPVYGTYSIAEGFLTPATLSIQTEQTQVQLFAYDLKDSSWQELDSTFENGAISAQVDSFATFVIVSSQE